LGEYTFLKRPVVIINDEIFVGSEKKNVESVKEGLCVDFFKAVFFSFVNTLPGYNHTQEHE
jgi:hypothetical protein